MQIYSHTVGFSRCTCKLELAALGCVCSYEASFFWGDEHDFPGYLKLVGGLKHGLFPVLDDDALPPTRKDEDPFTHGF